MVGRGEELHGVGLGWRPEVSSDLLRAPSAADFLEVVADTVLAQPRARREVLALRAMWPVALHGVKFSLGSADGLDVGRARKLGELARELEACAVTEHVAMTRGRAREIGHLTALPRTREAVGVVAKNVAELRRHLPDVPLFLENVAWALRWPDDALGEGEFHRAVCDATGCPMLLDVGNVLANAYNAGVDAGELLRSYPLERVGMIHIAGGVIEDAFYFDTHAHPLPGEELVLLEEVLRVAGPVPIILERDAAFPPFDELRGELDAARAVAARAPAAPRAAPRAPRAPRDEGSLSPALADAQEHLAELLTSHAPPADAAPFAARDVARTRAILERKRVDDALPLLPHLGRAGATVTALALACVRDAPRAARHVALSDAMAIAERAATEPALADDARVDRLLLRATFARGRDGVLSARVGPFVGHEELARGRTVWALKGIGAQSPLRILERRRP
jgi:uncharacterized protein